MSAFMQAREQRLRGLYVHGDIEIDDFERRIDAILRGQPLPEDEPLGGLTVYTDEPGQIWEYRPVGTAMAAVLKDAA